MADKFSVAVTVASKRDEQAPRGTVWATVKIKSFNWKGSVDMAYSAVPTGGQSSPSITPSADKVHLDDDETEYRSVAIDGPGLSGSFVAAGTETNGTEYHSHSDDYNTGA